MGFDGSQRNCWENSSHTYIDMGYRMMKWLAQGYITNSGSRIPTSIWLSPWWPGQWLRQYLIIFLINSYLKTHSLLDIFHNIPQISYLILQFKCCIYGKKKKSNSKTTEGNEKLGAISQKWDGSLQKWTDLKCHLENAFVFPIQCTTHNLKLTNQLWNALFCILTYGCSLQE